MYVLYHAIREEGGGIFLKRGIEVSHDVRRGVLELARKICSLLWVISCERHVQVEVYHVRINLKSARRNICTLFTAAVQTPGNTSFFQYR